MDEKRVTQTSKEDEWTKKREARTQVARVLVLRTVQSADSTKITTRVSSKHALSKHSAVRDAERETCVPVGCKSALLAMATNCWRQFVLTPWLV